MGNWAWPIKTRAIYARGSVQEEMVEENKDFFTFIWKTDIKTEVMIRRWLF